jgi:hypothetical protein
LGLLSGLGVNDRQLHNHLTPKEAAFNNYQDVEVGVVIPELKITSLTFGNAKITKPYQNPTSL